MRNLMLTMVVCLGLGTYSVGAKNAVISKPGIPIQYGTPADGNYIHGDHCMDSRVF